MPKVTGQPLTEGMQDALLKKKEEDAKKSEDKKSWFLKALSGSGDKKPPAPNTIRGNVAKKNKMLEDAMGK